MGEVTMASNGLLPKINLLFNNSLYSDVQFVFIDEKGTSEKIYCHKLILALQSKVFSCMFFEKQKSPSVMKMQASKKQLFYLMFKFLYTGDIQFCTFDEAQDLYEIANDYLIEDLVKKCHSYMLQSHLAIENIFVRYKHALIKHIDMLLKDCRNFVCTNVQTILKSNEFINASPEVIEDVVKLDNLPLSNELEIIQAVLNWGSESLKRKDIPYNEQNLRKSINPFLRHLRVLSLTSSEFHYLVEHYNIFTAFESMVLIQKIMMPDSNNRLPENFCYITSKRGSTVLSRTIENGTIKSNSPETVQSDLSNFQQSDDNKIIYEVTKHSTKNTVSSTGFKQKFNSCPFIRDIEFPALNFSQNLLRDFVFPLKKSEKSFKLSFRSDIKCWIVIKMKSGNISLYGFELKVKNKSEKKEELEVSVYLQGFSKQSFEKSYNVELQNDVLSVNFSKPMKLKEGSKGKLEVCIENLALDRSSQIDKKQYELNSGLNFECEFHIDSNKKTEDENFLFLINKLIYVPY